MQLPRRGSWSGGGACVKLDQPNDPQRKWREAVREQGCCVTSIQCSNGFRDVVPAEIHHPLGRTARQSLGFSKIPVGHWFVLPVCREVHEAIHRHEYTLEDQKRWFVEVCRRYMETHRPLPFDATTLVAILTYRR